MKKLFAFFAVVLCSSFLLSAQSWIPSSPNLYFTGGNVGIGTTIPTAKLHVSGPTRFGGSASIGRSGTHYDEFGYNLGFTSTAETYSYLESDFAASIRMGWNGDFEFRTAPLGTKGSNLTLTTRMWLKQNGNLGIGTNNPDSKLTVNGDIHAKEVRVDLNVPGPDYVFETDYKLLSLEELHKFISENNHLPEVPSASEMIENGINLSEMNMLLLKKVEELTLYLIEQNRVILQQSKEIAIVKSQLSSLKTE